MLDIVAFALGKLAEAFLGALADKVSSEVLAKLQGDPAKTTLKQALGSAIQLYIDSRSPLRLDIARPLLAKNSFLTQPGIANELVQIVRFEREPNAELIGQVWKAELDTPPGWCDFTNEAKTLLHYLRDKLRGTELFRPVFDSRSLDTIALSVTATAESLNQIESLLADLTQLWTARFSDLLHTFVIAPSEMGDNVRDYSSYISEKTHNFVGRKYVFDAIIHFIEKHERGYFFVKGDPGIGKSTLAAQFVKTHACVHHFNIRSEGINKPETFLRNICAQLIVKYNLAYSILPTQATHDSGFLKQLLGEVSRKLDPGQQAILLIDALDEVDTTSTKEGNSLYLPTTLPEGIFVVITTRRGPTHLRIDCDQGTFEIEYDSVENKADIHDYIEQTATLPGIQTYISAQGIDNKRFIDHLLEKSEGNFMYLRYVIPEIEHGAYKGLKLDALPSGLQNYYEDHWRRIRSKDEEAWFAYKLPIIMALTVVKTPISINLIADFAGVHNRVRIVTTLNEWEPFLHQQLVEEKSQPQKRYRIYHTTFLDFIAHLEEVHEEQVSRKDAIEKILTIFDEEVFGDDEELP